MKVIRSRSRTQSRRDRTSLTNESKHHSSWNIQAMYERTAYVMAWLAIYVMQCSQGCLWNTKTLLSVSLLPFCQPSLCLGSLAFSRTLRNFHPRPRRRLISCSQPPPSYHRAYIELWACVYISTYPVPWPYPTCIRGNLFSRESLHPECTKCIQTATTTR